MKSIMVYIIKRMLSVKEINDTADDPSIHAKNRDAWLIDGLKEIPKRKLTDEEVEEVRSFWEPYEFAYKNDYRQQEMFTAISGVFDPSYFGFGMQRYLLTPFWNHPTIKYIAEKNFKCMLLN